jgi:hypothetical protein
VKKSKKERGRKKETGVLFIPDQEPCENFAYFQTEWRGGEKV